MYLFLEIELIFLYFALHFDDIDAVYCFFYCCYDGDDRNFMSVLAYRLSYCHKLLARIFNLYIFFLKVLSLVDRDS